MKSKVFLYLFVIALLYIIFQQVNAKKKFEADTVKIESLSQKVKGFDVKRDSLENEIMDLSYFTLQYDDYAIEYVEDSGFTVSELQEMVTDALISKNSSDKDNPLIPFEGMQGNTIIDRVKLINHKWAIVDFTDGKYWGQVIYSFLLDKENTLTLDVLGSHLYTKVE